VKPYELCDDVGAYRFWDASADLEVDVGPKYVVLTIVSKPDGDRLHIRLDEDQASKLAHVMEYLFSMMRAEPW
jgi:hypothetical protein